MMVLVMVMTADIVKVRLVNARGLKVIKVFIMLAVLRFVMELGNEKKVRV